jgi:hypothetical protein
MIMVGLRFLDWVWEMAGFDIATRGALANDAALRDLRSRWVSKFKVPTEKMATEKVPMEKLRPPESIFNQRLESHLRDFKKGHPWRSLHVNQELRDRHKENRTSLAEIDPQSLRLYVGLISSMGYEQQARLAASVYSMNHDLMQLKQAGEDLK